MVFSACRHCVVICVCATPGREEFDKSWHLDRERV